MRSKSGTLALPSSKSSSQTGSSLIEMLVCTTIMGFVAMTFMSILLVNYKTNAKVSSISDTVSAVRTIKERIGRDVREGRTLGDVYGTQKLDPVNGGTYVTGSDHFPDATRNPIYGSAVPIVPDGWGAPPWRLGNNCLIVQIPVLDNHADASGKHVHDTTKMGWPTTIPQGWAQNGPPTPNKQENVETHVYRVLPDPAHEGEWILQMASYGGMAVPGYVPEIHTYGPQTILTGIIGPIDPSTQAPKVFQFVNRIEAHGTPHDVIEPDGSNTTEYTGVIVNLEVRKHQQISAKRKDVVAKPIAMKLEVFLRNNANATSTGQPSTISGVVH
jgi:type II secretory pathway pseudopilin PulG